MKPEYIGVGNFDLTNYVYSYCNCPLSTDYAIKWPRIKDGKLHTYTCTCEDCGTTVSVVTKSYDPEIYKEPCEDAISRDKAIVQLSHLLSDWDDDWNVAIRKCIETIKIVPPVTPQYTEAEIQRMQELEQAEIQKAYEFGKAEMQPCEDCISRQAVIDMTGLSEWFDSSDSYNEFVIALSDLPPVTPQPKTGHWITKEAYSEDKAMGFTEQIVCSNCDVQNSYFSEWDECKNPISKTFIRSKYCPNCGAKMGGERT